MRIIHDHGDEFFVLGGKGSQAVCTLKDGVLTAHTPIAPRTQHATMAGVSHVNFWISRCPPKFVPWLCRLARSAGPRGITADQKFETFRRLEAFL